LTTDPKSPLFPNATINDLRVAAHACRKTAKTTERWENLKADDVRYFINDIGGWPIGKQFDSWTEAAKMLEAEIDRLDPPKPSIIIYTTAPSDYDGFSVRELDANAGTDNRGKIVRKVIMETRDEEWYRQRCGSGLHATATQDEVDRFPEIWRLKS
jgi:hypothetical protein